MKISVFTTLMIICELISKGSKSQAFKKPQYQPVVSDVILDDEGEQISEGEQVGEEGASEQGDGGEAIEEEVATCGDVSSYEACDYGWYGEGCTIRCNCGEDDNCDESGHCVESDNQCARGWFGEKCQQIDAMQFASVNTPVLADNDHDTCLENMTVKTVNVTLAFPVLFTYLAIVVMEDETFEDFIDVNFVTEDGDRQACINVTYHAKVDDTLDIYCQIDVLVVKIDVTWELDRYVCSIHINAGRNFAMMPFDNSSKFKAVDGDKSNAPEKCWSSTSLDKLTWDLELYGYTSIYMIIITGTDDLEGIKMRGFTLNVYDESGTIVFSYTDDRRKPVTDGRYVIAVDPEPIVARIEIVLDNPSGNRLLHICELEAIGGCQLSFYGDTCSDYCPVNCGNDLCDYDGNCLWCKDGYYDLKCDKSETNYTYSDEGYTHTTQESPATTLRPIFNPETDRIIDLVFISLHIVFGVTIIAVIIIYVFLRIKDIKSSRASTVNSLPPTTLSGSLVTSDLGQKIVNYEDSNPNLIQTDALKSGTPTQGSPLRQ